MKFKFDRTKGLGGSDAHKIWWGYDIARLWSIKTKRDMEDDLSMEWKVQLGTYTESFHIDWLKKKEFASKKVTKPKDAKWSNRFDVPMYANVDALVDGVVLEVKHTNIGQTVEQKARYYAPQLHHYMQIYCQDYCWFSAIRGNEEPEVVRVDWNQEFYNKLLVKMKRFWLFVVHDKQPPIVTDKERFNSTQDILVDGVKNYDNFNNEEYKQLDGMLMQYEGAVSSFEETKKKMKLLVPKDARKCEFPNSNYVITRNKKGTLVVKTKGE